MTLKAGEKLQKLQKLLVHTAPILEKPPQVLRSIHVIIIRKGGKKRVNMNKIIWIDKTKISKKRRIMIIDKMISRDFWVSCNKCLIKIILLFNQNDISANFI